MVTNVWLTARVVQINLKNLIENIKESEGFVSHVYNDSLGIPTIG